MMDRTAAHISDGSVLVIGAAGLDIVGRPKDTLILGTSNPSVIRDSFGGVARNVSENLARLGQATILISAVGQDGTGSLLLEQAQAAGIDINHVLRVHNQSTGTYFAVLDPRNRLQIAFDDMAIMSALSPAYIESKSELFEKASLVFMDANLSKQTIRKVFSLARKSNIPVVADPTSTKLADKILPYLPRLKMVTPNVDEAEILCGFKIDRTDQGDAIEATKCLVSKGVEIAILAVANIGVCYATFETSGYIPAITTAIVDPTGGGDALTSAVLFALLNDIPIDDAIRLGVSASSLTLRYSGTVLTDLSLQKLYDHLVV
jgi:pseudouridine kinase